MSICYLTGSSNPAVRAVAHADHIGLMATRRAKYNAQLSWWPYWAADNGCFSQGDRFRLDQFYGWLERMQPDAATCLFAVAPDVMGDALATRARSLPVLPELRRLGYRAAYVGQPGATTENTPWGAFDVLFLGGGDWKLTPAGFALAAAARQRAVPLHMGQVNSFKRLSLAQSIGCASADGTFVAFGPDKNVPQLSRWLRTLNSQSTLWEAG